MIGRALVERMLQRQRIRLSVQPSVRIEWLEAGDIPLPEWPLDPVVFGPRRVGNPDQWRGKPE